MFTIVVGPALQSFFSEGNLARSVNFLCLIILLCVSVSFPLHKTYEVPYPKNYRLISLLPVHGKVLEDNHLLHHLTPWIPGTHHTMHSNVRLMNRSI